MPGGEGDRLKAGGKFPKHHKMQTPEDRPDQFQAVAILELQAFSRAGKEIRPARRGDHRQQVHPMRAFPEAQPEQEGRENNIQAGQETGIGDPGIQDADLLQGRGDKQNPARNQHPLPLGGGISLPRGMNGSRKTAASMKQAPLKR